MLSALAARTLASSRREGSPERAISDERITPEALMRLGGTEEAIENRI